MGTLLILFVGKSTAKRSKQIKMVAERCKLNFHENQRDTEKQSKRHETTRKRNDSKRRQNSAVQIKVGLLYVCINPGIIS